MDVGTNNCAPNWITVAERLPEPGRAVLIALKPGAALVPVWVGWYELAISGWVDSEGYPARVTHWAQLPEGPRA
jgi:hypothetical protein